MPRWEECELEWEHIPLGAGPGNLGEWHAIMYWKDNENDEGVHRRLLMRSRRHDELTQQESVLFELHQALEAEGWTMVNPHLFRRQVEE